MTTIQIFEYDKDRLDKIGDRLKASLGIPLITYPEIVGYLIRKSEEVFDAMEKNFEGEEWKGKDGK